MPLGPCGFPENLAGESAHLTLPEMSLAIVLVVDEDTGTRMLAACGDEEERRNAISVRRCVDDAPSLVRALRGNMLRGDVDLARQRCEAEPLPRLAAETIERNHARRFGGRGASMDA